MVPFSSKGDKWIPHPCQASSSSCARHLDHEVGWFTVPKEGMGPPGTNTGTVLVSRVKWLVCQYSWDWLHCLSLVGSRCFTASRQEDYGKSLNKKNSAREH